MMIGVALAGSRPAGTIFRYVRCTPLTASVCVVVPGVAGSPHPEVPPPGGGGVSSDAYVMYIEYCLASMGRLGAPYDAAHVPNDFGYFHVLSSFGISRVMAGL